MHVYIWLLLLVCLMHLLKMMIALRNKMIKCLTSTPLLPPSLSFTHTHTVDQRGLHNT